MIRIRAFKATDDLEGCQKFLDGHIKVLTAFGITMITSAKKEWMYDSGTYVVLAESEDGSKVFGGARIQTPRNAPLPIQEALEQYDASIHTLIKSEYENGGTGEFCGLWNSKEVAGMGLGSIFLTRVTVAISDQLNIKTLYALCAPYTVSMASSLGFTVKKTLGKEGTFFYPKDDLVATAMSIENVCLLEHANEEEKASIVNLRTKKKQLVMESHRNKTIEIDYDLLLKSI